MALYHDKFTKLVTNLKAILHEEDIISIIKDVVDKEKPLDRVVINELLEQVGKRTKSKIEYEIVSFLNENRNHLPFYHIPFLQPPEESQPNNEEEEKDGDNLENIENVENVENVENAENAEKKSVKNSKENSKRSSQVNQNSKPNSRHSSAISKGSENK